METFVFSIVIAGLLVLLLISKISPVFSATSRIAPVSSPSTYHSNIAPSADSHMMVQEFHKLCMSKAVPEAGLIMAGPNGLYQQWLYCNQASGPNILTHHPTVSFVEQAPVSQTHRVIFNEAMASTIQSRPKPPTVYILPPTINNKYQVDFTPENESSSDNHHHLRPQEPIIHFLSKNAQHSSDTK